MHTSTVNVVILRTEDAKVPVIDKKKLVFSYYKDSGNGGQKRNKTLSGVRIQYEDLMVECCETRSQHKNREIAIGRLKELISERAEKDCQRKLQGEFDAQNSNKGRRGFFTRNYNFIRDEIAQDSEKFSLSKFLKGDLSEIYEGRSCH